MRHLVFGPAPGKQGLQRTTGASRRTGSRSVRLLQTFGGEIHLHRTRVGQVRRRIAHVAQRPADAAHFVADEQATRTLRLSSDANDPENFLRYQKALGFQPPEIEHQQNGPLPQWYADEFGWQEMVEKVAKVYNSLPPEERARTAIFSNSWGEAAAVDFYGPRYGLPQAISKHNSYWIWGPRNYDGSIMIILRSDGRGDREHFQSVQAVGRVEHPYSRRDEHFDIYLCRGLKANLKDVWPEMKVFD